MDLYTFFYMLFKVLASFTLTLPIIAYATIYSWTDTNDVIHFSDEAQSKSVIIKKQPQNIAVTNNDQNPIKISVNHPSKTITIIAPQDQETIHNN